MLSRGGKSGWWSEKWVGPGRGAEEKLGGGACHQYGKRRQTQT